jgi:hypothetical protein
VFDMLQTNWTALEGEWDMDLALKIRGEEGQEEVLDLMEQGYSAQQIRDMLTRQPSTTTTVHDA